MQPKMIQPKSDVEKIFNKKLKVISRNNFSKNVARYSSHATSHVVSVTDSCEEWFKVFSSIELSSKPLDRSFKKEFLSIKRNKLPKTVDDLIDGVVLSIEERLDEIDSSAKDFAPVSITSLKRFLHLIPLIHDLSPSVSMESSSGLVSLSFKKGNGKVLNLMIEERNEFIFSLVKISNGLVKFSGKVTIVDERDSAELTTFISNIK